MRAARGGRMGGAAGVRGARHNFTSTGGRRERPARAAGAGLARTPPASQDSVIGARRRPRPAATHGSRRRTRPVDDAPMTEPTCDLTPDGTYIFEQAADDGTRAVVAVLPEDVDEIA